MNTDTEIVITTAAERIATAATTIAERHNNPVIVDFIKAEVIRVAMDELRQIDERAYQLGIRHAMLVPEINPEE